MNFIECIAATRMAVSDSDLVSCKGFEKPEGSTLVNVADANALGLNIDEDSCLLFDGMPTDTSVLVKAIQDWKELHEAYPKSLLLNEVGLISIDDNVPNFGRVAGRVIIITGGAQGFGGGLAEELYAQGAHIVVADLNEDAGSQMVSSLLSKGQANKAIFIKANVGDTTEVNNLMEQTVLQLGGIDTMISNAGILRAGGLEEMDADTFDLMTKVNYSAYFYCAKYSSKLMKIQSEVKPDHFMDIIQINSKSGLKGSNRNFAYAGGKFGGIGLTQSFALELMPNNIKVNSICPGNFFDGPLWSDPEKGLFVQYLKAGKVPGAETVADVQAFYEKQVPAGRGCRVKDVARAVLYVVEQEYETGQAIPVTGGQEMLK